MLPVFLRNEYVNFLISCELEPRGLGWFFPRPNIHIVFGSFVATTNTRHCCAAAVCPRLEFPPPLFYCFSSSYPQSETKFAKNIKRAHWEWNIKCEGRGGGRRRIVDQGVDILTSLQLQQQGHLLRKTRPRKLNGSLSQPRKNKLFWNSSILTLIFSSKLK